MSTVNTYPAASHTMRALWVRILFSPIIFWPMVVVGTTLFSMKQLFRLYRGVCKITGDADRALFGVAKLFIGLMSATRAVVLPRIEDPSIKVVNMDDLRDVLETYVFSRTSFRVETAYAFRYLGSGSADQLEAIHELVAREFAL